MVRGEDRTGEIRNQRAMSFSLTRFVTLLTGLLRRNWGGFTKKYRLSAELPLFLAFRRRSTLTCMSGRDARNKAARSNIDWALVKTNGDETWRGRASRKTR